MKLIPDENLERSAVVANSSMNRDRQLRGSNGYVKEIRLDPVAFLRSQLESKPSVRWLDLCCGAGRALIEAASEAEEAKLSIEILGVDLAGGFVACEHDSVRLIQASLSKWRPASSVDLITCVHGLHYFGDKLALISKAAEWLTRDGSFVANLDLANLRVGELSARRIAAQLRQNGLEYDTRRKLLSCGKQTFQFPFQYLGADDEAGPNYTGQPAVNSHYKIHSPDLC